MSDPTGPESQEDPMDGLSRATDVLRVLRRFAPEHRMRALQDATRLLGGAVEGAATPAGEVERLRAVLAEVRGLVPSFHTPNGAAGCIWCRVLGIIDSALNPTKEGAPE